MKECPNEDQSEVNKDTAVIATEQKQFGVMKQLGLDPNKHKFALLLSYWPLDNIHENPILLGKLRTFITQVNHDKFSPHGSLCFGEHNSAATSTHHRWIRKNDHAPKFIAVLNELAKIVFKNSPLPTTDAFEVQPQRSIANYIEYHQWEDKHGYTAFHTACRSNFLAVVEKMLDPPFYFMKAEQQDQKLEQLNLKVAQTIIRYILLKPTKGGYTPLISASVDCDDKIFHAVFNAGKKFLGLGSGFFQRFLFQIDNKYHLTAFHNACRRNRLNIVKIMLATACRIDRKAGNNEVVKKLLSNITTIDGTTHTPIDTAKYHRLNAIADLLEKVKRCDNKTIDNLLKEIESDNAMYSVQPQFFGQVQLLARPKPTQANTSESKDSGVPLPLESRFVTHYSRQMPEMQNQPRVISSKSFIQPASPQATAWMHQAHQQQLEKERQIQELQQKLEAQQQLLKQYQMQAHANSQVYVQAPNGYVPNFPQGYSPVMIGYTGPALGNALSFIPMMPQQFVQNISGDDPSWQAQQRVYVSGHSDMVPIQQPANFDDYSQSLVQSEVKDTPGEAQLAQSNQLASVANASVLSPSHKQGQVVPSNVKSWADRVVGYSPTQNRDRRPNVSLWQLPNEERSKVNEGPQSTSTLSS